MVVTFADPIITQERTYIPYTWISSPSTMETRGNSSFSSALVNVNPCHHCICSTFGKTFQCYICGKWINKRSRSDICVSCACGKPDNQMKCTNCDEVVHETCYKHMDVILCTKCGAQSERDSIYERLSKDGYIVMRDAFELDDDTLESIDNSNFHPIFNGVDEENLKLTYDGKRLMATGRWGTTFKAKLRHFLDTYGFLRCSSGTKSISEVYALRSLKGCPMQPKHADSATEEGLRTKDPTDVPLAVLYAIEPCTKLKIWPFDHDHAIVILLQPKDIVIFRGDTAHAGFKYDTDNTRLHAYIDSTADGCKRIKGKTYILVEQMYMSV